MEIEQHLTSEVETNTKKAWVTTADMGYGHQRAVYPLRDIAEGGIITVGSGLAESKNE